MTYAGHGSAGTEVYASVNEVIEESGECTVTFTATDGTAVQRSAPAVADASSTLCEPLVALPGVLAPGTWTVVVSYRSDAHEGDSIATTVEVA